MGTIVFFDKAKEELFTGGMNLSASINCVLLDPSFAFDIDISDYSSSISPFALGNVSGASSLRSVFGPGTITNSLLYTDDLNNAVWTNDLDTCSQNQTDIKGNANAAWFLEDSSAIITKTLQQLITVTADTNAHGISVFIKKDSDETRFPMIGFTLASGATIWNQIGLNTATGYYWDYNVDATASNSVREFKDSSGNVWWECRFYTPNNGAATVASLQIFPAYINTEGGLTPDATLTGSIILDEPMAELNISSIDDLSLEYVETSASASTGQRAIPETTLSATDVVSIDLSDVVFTASSSQNFSARYACLVQSGVNTPLAYMELSTSTIVAHKIKIVWP